MINKERTIAEFLELVQINSPTRAERQIADLLKARLTELGCRVLEDQVGKMIGGNSGNVIAYLPGTVPTAPPLMLGAHMDCVTPCENVRPVRKNGIITSSGDTILGADDKAGITAILEALRIIREEKIAHGDIEIVFSIAEEGGLHGAKNLDPSVLKATMGYELDSSGRPGKIVTKAPGQNQLTITIYGKKAHAGLEPEAGINAIVVAGKALAALQQGRIDAETTANVGIIHGGVATNIVPDKVEIICEARSRNLEKLARQTQQMCDTFKRVAAESGARVEITVEKKYEPYVLADDCPTVTLAYQAAAALGLNPGLESTGGGSDANFLNRYGIETAVLGIGMQKAHTTEEFITEEDLCNTAEWVVEIIKTASSPSLFSLKAANPPTTS